jgi:hypothetical protein
MFRCGNHRALSKTWHNNDLGKQTKDREGENSKIITALSCFQI